MKTTLTEMRKLQKKVLELTHKDGVRKVEIIKGGGSEPYYFCNFTYLTLTPRTIYGSTCDRISDAVKQAKNFIADDERYGDF